MGKDQGKDESIFPKSPPLFPKTPLSLDGRGPG